MPEPSDFMTGPVAPEDGHANADSAEAISAPEQNFTEQPNQDLLPGRASPALASAPTWRRLGGHWRGFLGDQITPIRLASHLAILLVAGLVLVLSRIDLPQWDVVRSAPAEAEEAGPRPQPAFNQLAVGGNALQESGVLLQAPVPFTEIPDRPRLGIITYTVQIEDTVLGIAEKFGLNPNTIVWANLEDLDKPFVMEVGQLLNIPPVDGVIHTVKDGDTIEKLSKEYKVTADKIVGYEPNKLASADVALTAGQVLVVPDGDRTPPEPPPPPAASSSGPRPSSSGSSSAPYRTHGFIWPTYGQLTQGYYRGAHPAIDIGAHRGTPVYAADEGSVSSAGWSSVGYGNYVVIHHGDGFVTLYAHLSRIDVSPGDYVSQGQQIGAVGSTGRSTGPHLHFEISLNGRTYNPLTYLP